MQHFSIRTASRRLIAFVLAVTLCTANAGFGLAPRALATPADGSTSTTDSGALEDTGLPYPTETELEEWEADGTLEERIAFQEALSNNQVSPQLIDQAQQQDSSAATPNLRKSHNLPADMLSYASMPTTGNAHVIALMVSFPAEPGQGQPLAFPEGDTLEALQNIIGKPLEEASGVNASSTSESSSTGSANASSDASDSTSPTNPNAAFAPYDSLNAYYHRASYGALGISGTAFTYTAQHPRSYYTDDPDSLFAEALASLDSTTDFSAYDGNNDGYLDAVYLHFAGETTGWGSTWWSNEKFYTGEPVSFDGKSIGGTVMLHNPSNTENGVRTAIHETGHLLGLPDYYSYDVGAAKKDPSGRTGILTFDMMNNNIGDHNAFSKWLLGWIDDSKITRIVANESGVVVKQGTNDPVTVSPNASGEAIAQASLSLLATDDPSSCGGFIALSNDEALLEPDGLFSSFYLMEYNSSKGNQAVSYYTTWDTTLPLPAGFRVFRIQAGLNDNGDAFIHTNTRGDVHNQLIELVDHDASQQHSSFSNVADGTVSPEYGCMMMQDDALTPEGYPSTNFCENINIGFTGISIAVTESTATQGTVEVSFSSALKPTLSPDAITLTLDNSRNALATDTVYLTSNVALIRSDHAGKPYVCVDGECKYVYAYIEDNTLEVSYAMPPELFSEGKACEIVFPANYFLIGEVDGQEVCSNEIRVSLPMGQVAQFARADYYENAVSNSYSATDAFSCEDESVHFVVKNEGSSVGAPTISLCTVNPEDPTKVTMQQLSGVDEPSTYVFDAVPTQGDEFCLLATSYLNGEKRRAAYWVSSENASAKAKAAIPSSDYTMLTAAGDTLFMASLNRNQATFEQYLTVHAIRPLADGSAETRTRTIYDVREAMTISSMPGHLALTGIDPFTGSVSARIVDLESVFATSNESTAASNEGNGASGNEMLSFPQISAVATLDISAFSGLFALTATDDGYLGVTYENPPAVGSPALGEDSVGASERTNNSANLTNEDPQESVFSWKNGASHEGNLTAFNKQGEMMDSALIATYGYNGMRFDAVSLSSNGALAVEATLDPSEGGGGQSRLTMLFEDGMHSQPTMLSNHDSANGLWLPNGAWLETGWNYLISGLIDESTAATGEYGAGNEIPHQVHYLLTNVLGQSKNDGENGGTGDGEDGDTNNEGEGGTSGTGNANGNNPNADSASSPAETGDNHTASVIACTLAALVAALSAAVTAYTLRKQS